MNKPLLETVVSSRFRANPCYQLIAFQDLDSTAQSQLSAFAQDKDFYGILFPKIDKFFGKKTPNGKVIKNSTDFASYLLEYAKIAVVPGSAFGDDNCFRLSYATSKDILTKGGNDIKNALNNLI